MTIDGRVLTAGIMLAIFTAMTALAFTFEPSARLMPLVVGIPGVIVTLFQFIQELRDTKTKPIALETYRREIAMFGWFVLFVVGIVAFGFIYAGPLLVAVYLYVSWHSHWTTVLGSAAVLFAILYGVFQEMLGLYLFDGLVIQSLFY